MYEKEYRVTITGASPLIVHQDDVMWADQVNAVRSAIKEKDKANFAAGDDRCPPDGWKGLLYSDGQHVAMSADNLRASIRKAAAKIELKGKETFMRLSQSGILFVEPFYPLLINGGNQITQTQINAITGTFKEQYDAVRKLGFQLFVKRAVVGMNKHVRVRPRFDDWGLLVEFRVVDEQITASVLADIWRIAGQRIGLGDWRPGAPRSPGAYGLYRTELTAI